MDPPSGGRATGAPGRRRPYLHAPVRLLAAVLVLLALPAAASARVVNAEDVLPPGQSGFVSLAGVPDGTGSPHLTDQSDLFVNFRRKPHTFDQPGTEEKPRPDVRIVRDSFGVPAIHARHARGDVVGRGLRRRAGPPLPARALPPRDDRAARGDPRRGATSTTTSSPGATTTRPRSGRRCSRRVPASLRDRMTPYKDGINAWIAHVRENPDDMPGEFTALGVPLNDWTEDDSVAVGIFLARTVPVGERRRAAEPADAAGDRPGRVRRAAAAAHARARSPPFPRARGRSRRTRGRGRRRSGARSSARRSRARSRCRRRGSCPPSARPRRRGRTSPRG